MTHTYTNTGYPSVQQRRRVEYQQSELSWNRKSDSFSSNVRTEFIIRIRKTKWTKQLFKHRYFHHRYFLKCQFLILVLGFHKKLLDELFQIFLMRFPKAHGFVKGVNWRKILGYILGRWGCMWLWAMYVIRAIWGNVGYGWAGEGRIKYQVLSPSWCFWAKMERSAFFSFCATKCKNKNPIFMTSALHGVKVNLGIHGLTSVHLGCIYWFWFYNWI